MHTPGPWETSVLSDGTQWEVCAAGGGDFIAATENSHDARLIARAPELRAALAWALDQIEDSLDLDHQAALAGARKLLKD